MGNTSSVIDGETVSRAQSVASDAAKVQQNFETTKDKGQKRALERESRVRQSLMEGKLLWKRAEIASDYSDLNQGLYKQPGMLSEPAVQVRVHPQSDLSTAKIQQNSETAKDLAKKELPPVLPLGTNRRGISQGSSWCCTPVWLVFNGRTGILGTAPSGSVQLQDYCVRPEKNGEPYFCYYRLLPQVARTYLCTRNLSDSPVVIAFTGHRCSFE